MKKMIVDILYIRLNPKLLFKAVHKPNILLFLLLFVCTQFAQAADNHQAQKPLQGPQLILFTGNSFSFYNNGIHNHVGSLVRSADKWQAGKNRFRLLTLSGSHIHEQLPLLKAMINDVEGKWQAVVLQGHSNEAVSSDKKEQFNKSLSETIGFLKEKSILPILFMTWEYEGDAQMGEQLARAYMAQGAKHQVPVVPVGLAFANAQAQYPDISLYVPDVLGLKSVEDKSVLKYRKTLKHPSEAGTYLAACVFYAALYNHSPQGLAFIGDLAPEQAARLQKVAWQTVQDFIK